MPIWTAQLFTGAKSFGDNPIIGSPALNRRGLHGLRTGMAHRMAAARRRRLSHLLSPADREAFDRDGFVVKPNFLPAAEFSALLAEIRAFRGEGREMLQGDTLTRRIAFNPDLLARLPGARKLLEAPGFPGIARYVCSFAAEPMVYLQTILTQVRDAPPDPQCDLHADTFHPTAKAWLFLTDVAADRAPLTFVPGSHRLTAERLAWERRTSLAARDAPDRLTRRGSFRIAPEELPALNLPPPRIFDVPANTLVVADTFGFHARGASDGPSFRVEIWSYGRHSPYIPWSSSLVWNIPWLARRRADIFWRWEDLMEGIGLKRGTWRRRPDVSAFDGAPPGG